MQTHPIEIEVSGHGESTHAPERCTVSLTVQANGVSAELAAGVAAKRVQHVTGEIVALYNSARGPVTWWSVDQIRHSRRPDSKAQATHNSSASFEVTFSKLDAIGAFVGKVADVDGVTVDNFDWRLTAASVDTHTAKVRDSAVQDAVRKANTYAASLGRDKVNAVFVSDREPIDRSPDTGTLKPHKVLLSADVILKFEA